MESRGERRGPKLPKTRGLWRHQLKKGGGGKWMGDSKGEGEKRGDGFALGDERKVLRSRH